MLANTRTIPAALALGATLLLAACASAGESAAAPDTGWPRYVLQAAEVIPLNLPGGERFDASGLLLTSRGDLLTVRDQGATLYRIQIQSDSKSANLVPLPGCFTSAQLAPFAARKHGHYDCEGIAQDEQGRLYVCEEADRWILRCDPQAGRVERLAIDWSPVTNYFSTDANASFEGIAIGNGKLYVANERSAPVLIAVDLASLKVVEHFVVVPQKPNVFGTHYSDLSWWNGHLFVLCRQHRVVLEVEPRARAVVAEFDYGEAEERLDYPTFGLIGLLEGLAVDRDWFWLVTDNNGLARRGPAKDTRPVLLKCPRPDKPGRAGQSRVATPPPPARLAQ
jgi:hypothetical protein